MSRVEGELVTCERCGTNVFLSRNEKEDKVLDGGFTRVKMYEDLPDGWGRGDFKDLCPVCFAEWQRLEGKFFDMKKTFFNNEGVVNRD